MSALTALKTKVVDLMQFGRPKKPVIGEGMDLPSTAYQLSIFDRFLSYATSVIDPDEVLRRAGLTRTALRGLEYDDEISQAMEQRFDTLMARGWTLTSTKQKAPDASTGTGESEDDTNIAAVTHELTKVMHDLIVGLFHAIGFGYGVVELVYRAPYEKAPGDTLEFGLKKAVGVPFEYFDFKDMELWHRYPEWRPVDPRKFIYAVRRQSYRNQRGEALYSRLYWVWFFRTHGWQFWMKYLERCGVPFLVGKTEAADKNQAAQALFNAVQNAVVAIGPNDSVEALDFGRNPEIFTKFEEAIVRRIQKLILGQTLTSGIDGGSGNKALGEVHERVTERKVNGDIAMLLKPIQQVVDIICAMNGIERLLFSFNPPLRVNAEQATRDVNLKNAGIVVEFSPRYLQRSYGFKPEEIVAGDRNTKPLGATDVKGQNSGGGSGDNNQGNSNGK